jgi:hypothetical protein
MKDHILSMPRDNVERRVLLITLEKLATQPEAEG